MIGFVNTGAVDCKPSMQSFVSTRCSRLQALGAIGYKSSVQSVASPPCSMLQPLSGVGCKCLVQASIVNSIILIPGCWAIRDNSLSQFSSIYDHCLMILLLNNHALMYLMA